MQPEQKEAASSQANRRAVVGPFCSCRSFNLSHPISRHSELRNDMDWRTESERRGIQRFQEPLR